MGKRYRITKIFLNPAVLKKHKISNKVKAIKGIGKKFFEIEFEDGYIPTATELEAIKHFISSERWEITEEEED